MNLLRLSALMGTVLSLLSGWGGCTTRRSEPEQPDDGRFRLANFDYTVSSEDGRELVVGKLILPWPMNDRQAVRGMWESRYVGPTTETRPAGDLNQIGPQIGQGNLFAEREDDEIRINLNPNMNDNNVMLIGMIRGDGLSGRWEYSTFVGVTARGSFQARRQP